MNIILNDGESLEELGIGGLKILQSKHLYRFTSDAILLTKFASVKKNEKVADLCSGGGIVGLHFYALNENLVKSVDMFELQEPLVEMCSRTIEFNGLTDIFFVHAQRVQDIGREYDGYFSLVLCNPPYERAGTGDKSLSESDRIARHEIAVTLEEIVSVAAKKLKYGGRMYISHRADRLTDLMCSMRENGIEPKRLKFVIARGETPYLVLLEGAKGGRPGIKIEPFIKN